MFISKHLNFKPLALIIVIPLFTITVAFAESLLPADVNQDNIVDARDLSLVLSQWGMGSQTSDINRDGLVGAQDLSVLLSSWGKTRSATPTPASTITPSPNMDPTRDAGASLPVTYPVSSIPAGAKYVAVNGSDTNTGTNIAPFATLTRAIAATTTGGTIIIRGGKYYEGNISISKSLNISSYPGEQPVFSGALTANTNWKNNGSFSARDYQPMPVADGSGISFSTCQNQTNGCVGKFPDQAWVGNTQLQQVGGAGSVVPGTFRVSNNQMYLANSDITKGNIEFSGLRKFASISAPNVVIRGLTITRYSNNAADYGVISFNGVADGSVMDNIIVSDSAFIAVSYAPSGNDLNSGSLIKKSIIKNSNWMGVSANATENFTLDNDELSGMNQWGEFTHSPQSGGLKTSRTWYTKVINTRVINNQSHGLWFDQSNYKTEVANNRIEGNAGTGLFFEISDYLYASNNYIRADGGARAVKLAGSSNLYMVNNTIIGGADTVGIYVDNRSVPGCSDPSKPLCSNSYNSDRNTFKPLPVTMTWIPSISEFKNNIFANPTATGYCGRPTMLCITDNNVNAKVPLETILHRADGRTGVGPTSMNGNVYAGNAANIVSTALGSYPLSAAFSNAMAGSPVSIQGLELNAVSGSNLIDSSGVPTSVLAAQHLNAPAIGQTHEINKYVPLASRHFGVLWK